MGIAWDFGVEQAEVLAEELWENIRIRE